MRKKENTSGVIVFFFLIVLVRMVMISLVLETRLFEFRALKRV